MGDLHETVKFDPLHITCLVDTQVEVTVLDDKMPHIGHHAQDAPHVFLCGHIDDGNAAIAAHAPHEQVSVIGREDVSSQTRATLVVTVNGFGKAVVEFQHIVHNQQFLMIPFIGIQAGHVDDAHRVVAPMGDGHMFSVMGTSHHFGQRTCLHQFHDLICPGIHHGDG